MFKMEETLWKFDFNYKYADITKLQIRSEVND